MQACIILNIISILGIYISLGEYTGLYIELLYTNSLFFYNIILYYSKGSLRPIYSKLLIKNGGFLLLESIYFLIN